MSLWGYSSAAAAPLSPSAKTSAFASPPSADFLFAAYERNSRTVSAAQRTVIARRSHAKTPRPKGAAKPSKSIRVLPSAVGGCLSRTGPLNANASRQSQAQPTVSSNRTQGAIERSCFSNRCPLLADLGHATEARLPEEEHLRDAQQNAVSAPLTGLQCLQHLRQLTLDPCDWEELSDRDLAIAAGSALNRDVRLSLL